MIPVKDKKLDRPLRNTMREGAGKEYCGKRRDSLRINRRLRAAVPVSYDFEPVALPEGEIVVHSGGVVVQRPHYQCGYNQKQRG